MNNVVDEALIILMEEAAEVQQAASKCVRFGLKNNWDSLERELGDLMCLLDWLQENECIDWENVIEQVELKKEKLKVYSQLYEKKPEY